MPTTPRTLAIDTRIEEAVERTVGDLAAEATAPAPGQLRPTTARLRTVTPESNSLRISELTKRR